MRFIKVNLFLVVIFSGSQSFAQTGQCGEFESGVSSRCVNFFVENGVIPGGEGCDPPCLTVSFGLGFFTCSDDCINYCALRCDDGQPKPCGFESQLCLSDFDENEGGESDGNEPTDGDSDLRDEDNNFIDDPDRAQDELIEDATMDLRDRIDSILDILTQSSRLVREAACELGGGADCSASSESSDTPNPEPESSDNDNINDDEASSLTKIASPETLTLIDAIQARDAGEDINLECLDSKLMAALEWLENIESSPSMPSCSILNNRAQ